MVNIINKKKIFSYVFSTLSMFFLGFVVAWALLGLAILLLGRNDDMGFYFSISLVYGFAFSIYHIIDKVKEIIKADNVDNMVL